MILFHTYVHTMISGMDSRIHGDPKVLMKVDIEGSEVELLPDLIYQQSLQKVDGMFVEFHERITKETRRKNATITLKTLVNNAIKFTNYIRSDNRTTTLISLDDESYFTSNFELPHC